MSHHLMPPPAPLRTSRAALAAAGAGVLVATLGGAASAAPAAPPGPGTTIASADRITDLGVAMQAPNVRLSDVDVLDDGTPVGYLFSDGEPVTFNVVDLRSGELLDSHPMAPYSVASSIDVAPDHTVYLSVRSPNDGTLWRYQPDTGELVEVASGIAGEQMLRTLDIDGGTLYGTTYPGATVYTMDLATEEITPLGTIAPESDYAWGLEADDGQLWAGAGLPAQLYSVDVDTGATTPIALPAEVAASGDFVQRIETYGDIKVISHRSVGGVTAQVHDGTGWVDALSISGLWLYTEQMAGGAFYYLGADHQPYAYDVSTRQSTAVDLGARSADTAGTTRLFLTELGTADFPGQTLVGVRSDGRIWRHNLATGHGDLVLTQTPGAPVTIMSIGTGGDGDVYVGGYLSPGVMARIDPTTGAVERLDGPEQADAITAHDDQTVVATYPGAGFYAADSDQAWVWGENPRHLFTLGRAESGQDRPRHLTSAGDLVAAGTISTYGELGGALTLFDPDTGDHETHRNIVPDQSVTDLAYADGVIYGGTSIYGGLDSVPTQSTAELFAWDLEEGLQHAEPVVPGAEVIHALAFDGAGSLWGMTDTGVLFQYDTAAGEVVQHVQTTLVHSNIWGSQSTLDLNPADGMLYGTAAGSLFRIDPLTAQLQVLVDHGAQRATVAEGDVYYTDTTNVFRYDLPAAPCDREITGTHTGPLRITGGSTCIVGATLQGPLTVTGGATVSMVGSQLTGPVRVTGAEAITVRGTTVHGPVSIQDSSGAVVLAGNEIQGPLHCQDNDRAPWDQGVRNQVTGPATGQCAALGE